ncbi:uncharacterized protein SETTUDRAFT_157767 [Exserohilum turcica Et28A]|uniref:Uncharacterized protein n=1 Tax=Exserohilum turcicum (strain 28A) TaxID=671987 RepID=R0I5A4_EXST2|nr:uncharacterized protein SETTUDRAFT_157767 [Exserohilum turcica Et28A]EOA80761.1 hypothetical protein SETTUDRAFT_157767 [Exserohilum turcica Et28A]
MAPGAVQHDTTPANSNNGTALKATARSFHPTGTPDPAKYHAASSQEVVVDHASGIPAPPAMSTRPLWQKAQPMHWILDWDGTITRRDTLDALVAISAAHKPAFPTMHHWQRVSQAYMDDYSALPPIIDAEKRLVRQQRDVEQRSLDRVHASAIFSGLTKQAIEEGAKHAIQASDVQLRHGFSSFHRQYIQARPSAAFAILSVNWSRHFIRSCLAASGIAVPEHAVLSNELHGIAAGNPSSGRIVSAVTGDEVTIVSSGDKLQKFKHMQQSNRPSVYVGDSPTDIECLLAADLGICIRDDPMGSSQRKLAEALETLQVACPKLKDCTQLGERSVVWATDFAEILEWLQINSL